VQQEIGFHSPLENRRGSDFTVGANPTPPQMNGH
jgi:hypothetical protein